MNIASKTTMRYKMPQLVEWKIRRNFWQAISQQASIASGKHGLNIEILSNMHVAHERRVK